MLLLGLTGSIATGKSTVSNILRSPPYSLPTIDADVVARLVVEPGTPAYKAIVAHFGPSTPDLLLDSYTEQFPNTGKGRWINRPALGRRVFGESEQRRSDRAVLNGIVHPAVRWGIYRGLVSAYVRGNWAVVLDVPLLFESGLDALCGTVMVVGCEPETQMRRLMARDTHLTEDEAGDRIRSQGDVREKARRAEARGSGRGVVVWNEGGREELRTELDMVVGELRRRSPKWWAWLLLLCPPMAGMAALWCWYRNRVLSREWKEGELKEKAKL